LPDESRPGNEPIRTTRQSNESQEASFMTVPAIGNIPVILWTTKIHVTSSSTQTSHRHQNYNEKDPKISADMGTQTDKSLMASYPPTSGRKQKKMSLLQRPTSSDVLHRKTRCATAKSGTVGGSL